MGIEIKEWANCVQSKKVCYKNKEHAEVAGVAYRQKAYPCKHCGYWHLASKIKFPVVRIIAYNRYETYFRKISINRTISPNH